MALPTLDATFASAADLPRRYMLAQWLVNIQYSGSVADYVTLPEYYLWAKIAVAAGAPRGEADYISLPKNYIWKDIYDAVSGSSAGTIDWHEKQAIGHIAAAYRGDTANPANLATYIDWPWRYQIASIVTQTNIDTDAQAFITTSGATDKEAIDQFVKGVKNLGLWSSMVSWPLRSAQNAGTGTTAYSLGGLGTYNGTLTNGPTWGVDGITYDGVDDSIATSFTEGGRSIFAGFVGTVSTDFSGGNSSKKDFYNEVSGTTPIYRLRLRIIFGGSFVFSNSNASYNNTTKSGYEMWSVLAEEGSATQGFASLENVATSTTTANVLSSTTLSNSLSLGAGAGTYIGTAAMAFIINKKPDSPNDFYNLYKTTLGIGLGLP